MGVSFIAWTLTSLAALARAGIRDGFAQSLATLLDPLQFGVPLR